MWLWLMLGGLMAPELSAQPGAQPPTPKTKAALKPAAKAAQKPAAKDAAAPAGTDAGKAESAVDAEPDGPVPPASRKRSRSERSGALPQ